MKLAPKPKYQNRQTLQSQPFQEIRGLGLSNRLTPGILMIASRSLSKKPWVQGSGCFWTGLPSISSHLTHKSLITLTSVFRTLLKLLVDSVLALRTNKESAAYL